MNRETFTPILRCSTCGSHLIELREPVTDHALVRCAKCGAGASPWVEFLSDLEARIERQQHERRSRRLRYRARNLGDVGSAWRLILSIPLDEARCFPVSNLPGASAAVTAIRRTGVPHRRGDDPRR